LGGMSDKCGIDEVFLHILPVQGIFEETD